MKNYSLFMTVVIALLSAVSCTNKSDVVLAVRLDKNKVELVKGQSIQLKASVVPDQSVEFSWFSQDEEYVTVDENGVVTALGLKKKGSDSDEVVPVSVYAKYKNGADECKVTVLPLEPTKVEIVTESGQIYLNVGESLELKAKVYPENADIKDVTWTTDYAKVASVKSKTGVLTGNEAGFATIRASYSEKIYDEVVVQVNKAK